MEELKAPITIDILHDILHYAFEFFSYQEKKIDFKEYFNKNLYYKKMEIEDLEEQEIRLETFSLSENYNFLLKNQFIENSHGITNKGIKAFMKMELIQYSNELNKQAKKWIALIE